MSINEFSLGSLLQQLKGVQSITPEIDFSIASLNDALMKHGAVPMDTARWKKLILECAPLANERQILKNKGFLEVYTEEHVKLLALWERELNLMSFIQRKVDTENDLRKFLKSIRGLPLEFLQKSSLRQEEFLRHWSQTFNINISGENGNTSQSKLASSNYLTALIEAEASEKEFKKELEERNRIIKKMKEEALRARSGYE